jgi:2-phosphoglycerate kinase
MDDAKNGTKRTWDVLLIGGTSGSGKTSISYRVARHFGVGITEVDDFQEMLLHTTTPEQQPALHYWSTHPEAVHLPAEKIMEQGFDVRAAMKPGLEAVIANHLESRTPIVLEGDYILPALAAQAAFLDEPNNGRVKGLFLLEPDESQLLHNFLQREPDEGEQLKRARVSLLYNQWFMQETDRLSVPTVLARPWRNVLERALAAIG